MKAAHGTFAFSALLAVGLSLAPTEAKAAGDAKGFGEKHQLIISADRLIPFFSYTRASVTNTVPGQPIELTNSQSGAGLSLLLGRNVGYVDEFSYPINVHLIPRVAFDFTIIERLTLGAAIAFGFGLGGSEDREALNGQTKVTSTRDSPTATAIGLAPRVGYIIPFHEYFAFWPRGGFGFYSVSLKSETVDNNNPPNVTVQSLTDTMFSLDIDPQLVFTPTEHLFFQVGPLVNIPLTGSRSGETTRNNVSTTVSTDTSLFHFGIHMGIGGWIGF